MKKIIWIVVIVLVIWGVVAWSNNDNSPTSSEPFKIGVILPLSGDYAAIGEEIERGAELAVDELNKEGRNIVLVSEDDQFSPAKSVTAANKLITIDKADALFTAVGEEARPVTKVANDNKVPLLVAFDSNKELKEAGDYIFSIGFSSEGNGEKMANYVYTTLGLRKFAVLSHVDNVADILADSFKAKFTSLGGVISSADRVVATEKNYRAYIAKIIEDKPDGVYMVFLPPANQLFLTQSSQLNLKTKFFGTDAVQTFEIADAGAAAENLSYTGFYVDDGEKLAELYLAKFGREPENISFIASGYDSVITLAEGKVIADEEKIPLREALMKVNTTKTTSPVNMNGTQFSERIEKIYKVVNGKSEVIE